MSRARLLKPGFFVDAELGRVSRDSRLAFGGIWTESDDEGYFEWKPTELAWTLFRYDADKEQVIERALAELADVRLIERLECGIHGLVDSMPEHRIQGGNHSSNFQRNHARSCLSGQVRTGKDSARPDRAGASQTVRTGTDTVPAEAAVRTGRDESLSESVSESLKGRREKKNVKEEGVEVQHGAGAPDPVAEPAPFLTRPVVESRLNASPRPPASSAVTVPPRLVALTPQWRGGPCTNYVAHQSRHRVVDMQAVCDACDEERAAAAAAKPNGVDHGDVEVLGL